MELSELTFYDVVSIDIFKEELTEQLTREMLEYEKASTMGNLKRCAMNGLRDRGLLNVKDMTAAFYLIKHKEASGYSANERQYINDVCMLAYQRTILRLKEESEENDRNPLLRWVRQFHAWLVSKLKNKQN